MCKYDMRAPLMDDECLTSCSSCFFRYHASMACCVAASTACTQWETCGRLAVMAMSDSDIACYPRQHALIPPILRQAVPPEPCMKTLPVQIVAAFPEHASLAHALCVTPPPPPPPPFPAASCPPFKRCSSALPENSSKAANPFSKYLWQDREAYADSAVWEISDN